MNNFIFDMPTKLYFGENSVENIKTVDKLGKKILLVYGKTSAKKSGLYDKIASILKERGAEIVDLAGVEYNPSLELVEKGIDICKKENIDFVFALGGGSVIDTAKAVALGAVVEDNIWNYFSGKTFDTEPLPIGVVLTLPATGSETSPVTIVADKKKKIKGACSNPKLRPVFSILDPTVTYTLPKYQVACGAVDIFSHMFERYFTPTKDVELTDRLLEAGMKNVVQNALASVKDLDNYKYRSELMLTGALAHNDALSMGRVGDWGIHTLERIISGYYNNAHGEGLACLIPAWTKVAYKTDIYRFARFFKEVFGVDYTYNREEEAVITGIYIMENFFKSLGLCTRFSETKEISITDEHINEISISVEGSGNFFKMTKKDVVDLLQNAK